ncbi:MAG TPA: Gfo/Idh/MocA family oxidoreductase [Mycobacteriales bacterium]|nr:Gfo/Idh/MocA family oxidoreductase [Mycobacteriales bacterium]
MTNGPLPLLHVGLGGWGRDWSKAVVPEVDTVRTVAYADPAAGALELLETDLPRFTDVQKALAESEAEGVLVTSGVFGHVPVVQAALEAGKHVLVEKPFAPTVAEAEALVALAEKKSLMLSVSQNYRFFPAPIAVRELVAGGSLGKLHRIDLTFRRLSSGGKSPHHQYDEPLLYDMSVHHFDLMRFVTGLPVERVYAETWNPEWSHFVGRSEGVATVRLAGDVGISYSGSWVSNGPATAWAGDWRMDFADGQIEWTSRNSDGVNGDHVWITQDGNTTELDLPDLRLYGRRGSLAAFAESVRTGVAPHNSGADNIGTLRLMLGSIESSRQGTVVQLG